MLPADAAYLQQMLPDNFLPDGTDIRSQLMYFEATNLLTGDFLAKVDRASMAASLEVRCPLLDHRFAEFATGIPTNWKWQNGNGKQILLKALGDRLAPGVADAFEDGLRRSHRPLVPRTVARAGARQSAGHAASLIAASCRRNLCATCCRNTTAAAAAIIIRFTRCSCWSCGSRTWKSR